MGNYDNLSAKKRKAVLLLLSTPHTGEVCEQLGISRPTLHRWRANDEFKSAMREAKATLWLDGLRVLLVHQRENLGTILHLRDTGDTDATRLRAAVEIERSLQHRWASLETAELEKRIEALEAANAT